MVIVMQNTHYAGVDTVSEKVMRRHEQFLEKI